MPVSVRIEGLGKRFTSPDDPAKVVDALLDASLTVAPGELMTLLGPSGCGKTTLLRLIAGFEAPTTGDIWFGDRHMNDVAPNRRNATMVFQSYAIFPHLDVAENVAFGLRLAGLPKAEVTARVTAALAQAGLAGMGQRAPSQLSGGQQQRVALAHAMVMEPGVLLFDEPLSNLDAKLRDQMRIEIRELQKRLGITSLYVTHDQIEAMSLSDRVVVMNEGRIAQIGTPVEIYARPASRFVASFIGKANFLAAEGLGGGRLRLDGRLLEGVGDALPGPLTALLRPEAIAVLDGGDAPEGMQVWPGKVQRIVFAGSSAEYLVAVPGLGDLLIDVPHPAARRRYQPGEALRIGFHPAALTPLVD